MTFLRVLIDDPACEMAHLMGQGVSNAFFGRSKRSESHPRSRSLETYDDLPFESRILVASSIEVVCTPSFDLRIHALATEGVGVESDDLPMPSSPTSGATEADAPDQGRRGRETSGKHGQIELIEE